ncbi:MAG: glycosyltransferase family 39 protein [Acidimicrobiales bacterium]
MFVLRSWLSHRAAPLAVFAGLVAVLRLPSFVGQIFDPDEAAVSAQAIGLWRGGEMYIDGIDRKPPIAPFIYEWSHQLIGSTDLRPLHLLAGVMLLSTALVVAHEGRRIGGTQAMWWGGALMLTGAVAMVPVDAQAANYSHLAMPFGALAMVAARRGTDRTALITGLALAIATLTRQTWAIGVIPATFAIWRYGDWRRHLPIAFVGGLLPIAVVALVVPWEDFMYWSFESNGSFVLAGADPLTVLWRGVLSVAVFVGCHSVAVWFTGRSSWRHNTDLWLWLVTGLIAVAAGYRFYGHYWMQVVPPLALIAADELRTRDRSVQHRAGRVVAATAVVAFVLAWTPSTIRDLPDPTPLADFVAAQSTVDDTVLIWGNFPEVYWEAERAPAGGFVSMDFVTGRSGTRDNGPHTIDDAPDRGYPHLMDSVEAKPPAVIIDTQPSEFREYGDYPIALFPELEDFIGEHYAEPMIVDGFTVYLRS